MCDIGKSCAAGCSTKPSFMSQVEQDFDSSASSSTSPLELDTHLSSVASASPQPEDVQRPVRSARSIAPLEGREKRRRSRVTPEQLLHLERYFSTDRSPTAARRKEISELLGMHERQTQIWFQNRRAKAKIHDGKNKTSAIQHAPEAPPQLCAGFDAELHTLIHEDEAVTIIPCSELSIGSWRRIATAVNKHDLVAYVCEAKQCITWFIHSAGHSFKMELPFNIVVDTSFTNLAPGMGVAVLRLVQPPLFFLEHVIASGRIWRRCADWTEGMQATKVLHHELTGSAVQLAHILRYLNSYGLGAKMSLYTPAQPVASRPADCVSMVAKDPVSDDYPYKILASQHRDSSGALEKPSYPFHATSRADSPYEYPSEPQSASDSSYNDTPSPPVLETPFLSPSWQEHPAAMSMSHTMYSGACMGELDPHVHLVGFSTYAYDGSQVLYSGAHVA